MRGVRLGAEATKARFAPPWALLGHVVAFGRTMYTWSAVVEIASWLRFHDLQGSRASFSMVHAQDLTRFPGIAARRVCLSRHL